MITNFYEMAEPIELIAPIEEFSLGVEAECKPTGEIIRCKEGSE